MMRDLVPVLCPVDRVMTMIGAKWARAILWHLFDAPLRFGPLRRMLPEASPKILTTRLRELEEAGLIQRHVLSDRPFAGESRISGKGATLPPVFAMMTQWSVAHLLSQAARANFLGGTG